MQRKKDDMSTFLEGLGEKLEGLGEKNVREIKYLLQTINDTLEGGLRSINMNEYCNTYVFNNFGILDADHDLIVDFELIDEMTYLVQCKVGFKARNFRSGVII